MKRRRFVGALGAGLAAAGVPSFVSQGFAQTREERDPDAGAAAVAEAYRRAHLAGRPLLVVIIPESDGAKWERGYAWGELLNHGSDVQLAPLAAVSFVAALREDVARIVPDLARASSDPLAVLVETHQIPAQSRAIDAELPDTNYYAVPEDLDWNEREAWIDARITERIAILAESIADAVAPNLPVLRARAAQQEARLEPWQRRHVAQAVAGQRRLSAELADRAAAIVTLGASTATDAQAEELRARLAAAVRERVSAGPPAGARWARGTGCGIQVEQQTEEEEAVGLMMACGMGHVPARSQRFLYFFTESRY